MTDPEVLEMTHPGMDIMLHDHLPGITMPLFVIGTLLVVLFYIPHSLRAKRASDMYSQIGCVSHHIAMMVMMTPIVVGPILPDTEFVRWFLAGWVVASLFVSGALSGYSLLVKR